jgi:LmbE family N-acetylglucosaminyl deacetylase
VFENLTDAAAALLALANAIQPNAIVSHAYEGGHIDHDSCSFLAQQIGNMVSIQVYEFPLYWRDDNGCEVFGMFKDRIQLTSRITLSAAEVLRKEQMLRAYETQASIVSLFPKSDSEWIRPAAEHDWTFTQGEDYSFENRAERLSAQVLIRASAHFASARQSGNNFMS